MNTIARKAAWLLLLPGAVAFAQTPDERQSGAVESFAPELSAAYVMEPRAGLYGITELMMAGLNGDLDAAAALIAAGADVNATDNSQSTALMWSSWSGNIELVRFLLDKGAEVNTLATNGANALGNALTGGHPNVAVLLLDEGADPNTLGDYSRPHLELAARSGYPDVVDALIRHGVDVDRFGPGALNIAVAKVDLQIAKRLIDAGTDVDAPTPRGRSSALVAAAYTGNEELVAMLLDAGADPKGMNPNNTPLRVALDRAYLAVAQQLIERGAEIRNRDLSAAISADRADVTEFVLNRLDVDTLSEYELEELVMLADSKGRQDLVLLFLNAESAPQLDDDTVRLLSRQRNGASCVISVWSPENNDTIELGGLSEYCDAPLFVSDHTNTVFAAEHGGIHGFNLSNDAVVLTAAVPTELMNRELEALKARMFEARSDIDVSWMTAEVAVVGYLETGDLAVGMHVGGPADGTYGYLFGLIDGEWQLVSTQNCHRFDWRCRFAEVNGRSIDDWRVQRSVWHPAIQMNRYFQSKSVAPMPQAEYGGQIISIAMNIDGEPFSLVVETTEGGHCADECTYTSRLVTRSSAPEPIVLAGDSGNPSIAGRFVLVSRGRDNGFELVDIRTGDSLFGRLDAGTWVEGPSSR